MMIIPERQACFIHIPHTGGTAFQAAIERAFPKARRMGEGWEHVSAHAARRMLPSPTYRMFTVIRNPWDIFASHWRWVRQHRDHREPIGPPGIPHGSSSEIALAFADMVRTWIALSVLATDGGFAARYCDPATIIFRYEDNPWPQIAALLDCKLVIAREDESSDEMPTWDEVSIELVGQHCRDDVRRFRYAPPSAANERSIDASAASPLDRR